MHLSAFRKKPGGGYEPRVVETEGRRTNATVAIRLPLSRAAGTDLLGRRLADVAMRNGQLAIAAEPCKILTFHLE